MAGVDGDQLGLAARGSQAVGDHELGGGGREDTEHPRVVQPARVVDHACPGGDARAGHLGPRGVHRDHHVAPLRDTRHDRNDPVELLLHRDGRAAPEGHPADVDPVGAGLIGAHCRLNRAVQSEGGIPVVKGVGGAVHDRQDGDLPLDVELSSTDAPHRPRRLERSTLDGGGGHATDDPRHCHRADDTAGVWKRQNPRPGAEGSRGGRYWDRTSDLFRVREARYRCANRPLLPAELLVR